MSRLYNWLLGLWVRGEVAGWYVLDSELRDRMLAHEAFLAHGGNVEEIERVERAYGVSHD